MDFLASLGIVGAAALVGCAGGVVGAIGGLSKRPALRWGVLALGSGIVALLVVLAVTRHDGQPWIVGRGRNYADTDAPIAGVWFRTTLFWLGGGILMLWLVVGGLKRGKG